MIDKEILLMSRNSDNAESDIGMKILIIFKESLHSEENLVYFHQKSIKVHNFRQMRTFCQKVHEFC